MKSSGIQKYKQNKKFWDEAERCLQCWRNMSARSQRQKVCLLILWVLLVPRVSLNPWREFVLECQESCWTVSIVQSLSVSQLCWPQVYLVSTHLPGLEAGSECSRKGEIKKKRLCSHSQCCCVQDEMLLQPKHLNCQWRYQMPPHQLFLRKVSSAEKSSTATGHKKYPKRVFQVKKTQNTWLSMTLSSLDCLHGASLPLPSDYIVLSLAGWLYSADTLQQCSALSQTLPRKVYWAFNDC